MAEKQPPNPQNEEVKELDEKQGNEKVSEEGDGRKKKRGKGFYIGLTVLAALLVAGIFGGQWIYKATNVEAAFADDFASPSPTVEETSTPIPTPAETAAEAPATASPTSAPTPTPEPTLSPEELLAQQSDPEFLKKRVNVLVLGLDRSKEREKSGSFRTDTMILVSVNLDDKTATMISIPRDSFVKIHNKKARAKINTAFGTGGGLNGNGYEYAMKTVSKLFGGVAVDYYVGFDMQLVKDLVDVIGGVDYDVDIEVRMNGRELHPGQQRLDGQGVLDYCRIRKGSSDIARVDRQQRMLMAIFAELKNTNQILNIPKIYTAVMDNMDTNLSLQQISSLALFANEIGLDNIQRHTVEGDYLFMYERSYWGISNNKLKKLAKEVFGMSISPDPADDVYYVKARYQEEMAALAAEAEQAATQAEEAIEDLPEEGEAAVSIGEEVLEELQAFPEDEGGDEEAAEGDAPEEAAEDAPGEEEAAATEPPQEEESDGEGNDEG